MVRRLFIGVVLAVSYVAAASTDAAAQFRPPNYGNDPLDGGYFDHAHFIHDFRDFSGINPSKYLADFKDFPRHHNHLPIA